MKRLLQLCAVITAAVTSAVSQAQGLPAHPGSHGDIVPPMTAPFLPQGMPAPPIMTPQPAWLGSPPVDEIPQQSDVVPPGQCPPPCASPAGIQSTVVLLDISRTMAWSARWGCPQSKFAVAQWAIYDILDAIPEQHPFGLVLTRQEALRVRSIEPLVRHDLPALRRQIMRLTPGGVSSLARGLREVAELLKSNPTCLTQLVVITDGEECSVSEAHGELANLMAQYSLKVQVLGITEDIKTINELRALGKVGQGALYTASVNNDLLTALNEVTGPLDEINATRAAKCRQCEADVARLNCELSTSAALVSTLECERNDLHLKLHCCQENLAAEQCTKKNLESELSSTKCELKDAQESNARCSKELACCREQHEKDQKTICELTTAGEECVEELQTACCEIQRLKQCLSGFEHQRQAACCELEKSRLAEEACQKQLCEKTTELEKQRSLSETLAKQLNECGVSVTKLNTELECCHKMLASCKEERDRCQCEQKKLSETILGLNERLTVCTEAKNTLAKELCDCRSAAVMTAHELTNLRQQVAVMQTQLNAADLRERNLQTQYDLLRERLYCCELGGTKDKLHLESLLAAARQEAIGATREMAANKKDCCGCCNSPGPVFGPIISPTTSTPTSPLGGNPIGGMPVGGNPVSSPVAGSPVGGTPVGSAPVGTPVAGSGPGAAVGGAGGVGGAGAPVGGTGGAGPSGSVAGGGPAGGVGGTAGAATGPSTAGAPGGVAATATPGTPSSSGSGLPGIPGIGGSSGGDGGFLEDLLPIAGAAAGALGLF